MDWEEGVDLADRLTEMYVEHLKQEHEFWIEMAKQILKTIVESNGQLANVMVQVARAQARAR